MSQFQMAPVTPGVKKILIATFSVWFVLQIIMGRFFDIQIWKYLALTPEGLLEKFQVWQIFTYQFLHALSPTHIIFNMLMVWFVGAELESRWGQKFFLSYYLLSGAGAALIYSIGVAIYAVLTGFRPILLTPVLGASGSLFGLLLAYGIIFSDRVIYFMGFFPLKAKHFVMLAGLMDLLAMMGSGLGGSDVAYLAHLGGIVSGFILLRGSAYLKARVQIKAKKRSANLRLVVDNEKKNDPEKPKYWN